MELYMILKIFILAEGLSSEEMIVIFLLTGL